MRPRIRVGEGSRCTSGPEDGRFFAPLRMTCLAMAMSEVFRSSPRQTCHPEEAALPASDSSAGRLTKDLLRHRLMSERVLSFAVTRQAARLRLHGHPKAARGRPCVRAYGLAKAFAVRQAQKTGDSSLRSE